MIQDKVIKFGYGTVVVRSDEMFRTVYLDYIQPSKKIGRLLEDDIKDIEVLETVKFTFKKDMLSFYDQLGSITEQNPKIEFRGYTFDFSNFNKESLRIVLDGFKTAIRGWSLALAC